MAENLKVTPTDHGDKFSRKNTSMSEVLYDIYLEPGSMSFF